MILIFTHSEPILLNASGQLHLKKALEFHVTLIMTTVQNQVLKKKLIRNEFTVIWSFLTLASLNFYYLSLVDNPVPHYCTASSSSFLLTYFLVFSYNKIGIVYFSVLNISFVLQELKLKNNEDHHNIVSLSDYIVYYN